MPYQFADYGKSLSTAANVKGRELRNRLTQQKMQAMQAESQRKNRLGQLSQQYMQGGEGQDKAFSQIASMDPERAKELQSLTSEQREQRRQEALDFARPFVFAMKSDNPQQAYTQALQVAREKYPERLKQIGMPEQFDPNTVGPKLAAIGQAVKDLAPDKGDQFSKNLVQGVDEQGNPVFLQASGQGGARPVEGFRPSPNRKTVTDNFGNSYIINLDEGTVQPVRGGQQEQGDPQDGGEQGGQQGDPQDPATNLFGSIERGTGPMAQAKSLASNVIGPFVEGSMFPETNRAKTAIRTFNQEAKTALVNNPRFPVAEQELVQRLLPDTEQVFTDPDAQRESLQQLRQHLLRKKELNEQTLNTGRITEKEAGTLANQNAAIDRIVGMMGDPEQQGRDIQSMGVEDLQSLDRSQLSDEELQQAADRWDELQGGQ